MLNQLPQSILLDISIFFTSLAWAVIAAPLPAEIAMLWYVPRKPRKMLPA